MSEIFTQYSNGYLGSQRLGSRPYLSHGSQPYLLCLTKSSLTTRLWAKLWKVKASCLIMRDILSLGSWRESEYHHHFGLSLMSAPGVKELIGVVCPCIRN